MPGKLCPRISSVIYSTFATASAKTRAASIGPAHEQSIHNTVCRSCSSTATDGAGQGKKTWLQQQHTAAANISCSQQALLVVQALQARSYHPFQQEPWTRRAWLQSPRFVRRLTLVLGPRRLETGFRQQQPDSSFLQVYVRPVSGKRAKKPSALDKHIRHVVLQQRANRQKAQQHAATVQHKHTQHQRFLDWGRRLRHAILRRGASSSRQHRQERPAQPMTAPAAPAAGDPQQQQQQHADDADHACADTLQSWRPVAAAAQVRELQESTRKQETLLRTSLPRVLDPSTLSTDHQTQHHQQQLLQEQGQAWKHNSRAAARAPAGLSSPSKQNSQCVGGSGTAAAEGQLHGDSGSLLDVDAFLDSLLQTASAAPATAAPAHTGASAAGPLNPSASSTLQQQQQQRDNVKSGQESSQAAALHQQRPASTCSSRKGSGRRGGSVPAWVLSEAAAAEAEEETLLEFAQGLNFQVGLCSK